MSIGDRQHTPADESTPALLSQAAQQVGRLAREEIAAARAEFAANRRTLGIGGGLLGGAGLLGFVAVEAVAAAAIAALAETMPVWAAALIVAGAAGAGAGAAALLGKKQVEQAAPAVQETVESVKADVAAIKEGGR